MGDRKIIWGNPQDTLRLVQYENGKVVLEEPIVIGLFGNKIWQKYNGFKRDSNNPVLAYLNAYEEAVAELANDLTW